MLEAACAWVKREDSLRNPYYWNSASWESPIPVGKQATNNICLGILRKTTTKELMECFSEVSGKCPWDGMLSPADVQISSKHLTRYLFRRNPQFLGHTIWLVSKWFLEGSKINRSMFLSPIRIKLPRQAARWPRKPSHEQRTNDYSLAFSGYFIRC